MLVLSILVVLFCIFFFIGVHSVCFKIVFEMDRDKDVFIKKTKYCWQRNYQTKILCKLSDIKTAYRSPNFWFNKLYLKLEPSHRNILIFWCVDIGRPAGSTPFDGPQEMIPLIKTKEEINSFLHKEEKRNTLVNTPLLKVSLLGFGYSLVVACYIALFIINSNTKIFE